MIKSDGFLCHRFFCFLPVLALICENLSLCKHFRRLIESGLQLSYNSHSLMKVANSMMNFLRRFMYGRYGNDSLNNFLMVIAFVLLIPYWITRWSVFWVLIVALLAICYYRMLSRRTYKRAAENSRFMTWWAPIRRKTLGRSMQLQDKEHRYFKCPVCHKTLRVPRGRGKISITCPHCKHQFIKKT